MLPNNDQFSIIEDIREKKGIGTGNGGGENEADLHRAIEHLSDDLYSKDIHFILELIQNAEDNPYSLEKGPQLVFKILQNDPTQLHADGSLLIINNELGFSEANVRAICRVGDSTKTKREGYIGEKGIGFKSVFLITDQPFIFSAGYQFYFKDEPDPEVGFGYIIPYWVSNIPIEIQGYLDQTCILLPFRPGKRSVVENELRQIAPETILFLNKLKALQVCVGEELIAEVIRVDEFLPVVELYTNGNRRKYWLSEKEVVVEEKIREEKREGVTNRKISIAFPMENEPLANITIYAFLPTSPNLLSGFDFLVNADFILSSSREQIQEYRPWNQWLRDSISSVFIEGFESMLQDQNLRFKAYFFIPLENKNRNSFFQPVVISILNDLREKEIIITNDGSFVKPDQARFATEEVRKLFDIEPMPEQLQKTKLVAIELELASLREKLTSIGIKDLSSEEIITCLRDEDWVTKRNSLWFFDLYKYLQNQAWATKDALKDMKLIPSSEGQIYSPSELKGAYLPTVNANEIIKIYKKEIAFSGIKLLDFNLYELLHSDQDLEEWARKSLIFLN